MNIFCWDILWLEPYLPLLRPSSFQATQIYISGRSFQSTQIYISGRSFQATQIYRSGRFLKWRCSLSVSYAEKLVCSSETGSTLQTGKQQYVCW